MFVTFFFLIWAAYVQDRLPLSVRAGFLWTAVSLWGRVLVFSVNWCLCIHTFAWIHEGNGRREDIKKGEGENSIYKGLGRLTGGKGMSIHKAVSNFFKVQWLQVVQSWAVTNSSINTPRRNTKPTKWAYWSPLSGSLETCLSVSCLWISLF